MKLFKTYAVVIIALSAPSAYGMNSFNTQAIPDEMDSIPAVAKIPQRHYRLARQFPLHAQSIRTGVKFSDDGELVITCAGYTNLAQVWNIKTAYLKEVVAVKNSEDRSNVVYNKAKTKYIYCGLANTLIKSCANEAVLYSLPDASNTAAFNYDDSMIATISLSSNTVKVWCLDKSEEKKEYQERNLYERLRHEILHPTKANAIKNILHQSK